MKGKVLDTEDLHQFIPLCGDFVERDTYYFEKWLFISYDGEYIQEVFERREVKGKKKPEVRHEVKVLQQKIGEAILKSSGFKLENLGLLRSNFQSSSSVSPSCAS